MDRPSVRLLVLALPALSQCIFYPAECREDAECGGAELCWDRRCEPIVDRYWTIEVVGADVDWLHPDGAPWDTDGSPPDLYTEYGMQGDGTCLTPYVPDTIHPTWLDACDFYVPPNPSFTVDLWDVDDATDEYGTGFEWTGTRAFVELARAAAGQQVAFADPSGTAFLWVELWPL